MILLFPLAFLHFPYKTSFSSANPFGNTVLILYVYVCVHLRDSALCVCQYLSVGIFGGRSKANIGLRFQSVGNSCASSNWNVNLQLSRKGKHKHSSCSCIVAVSAAT